jgi:predicted CXXCH cytochrome family protein
MVNCDMRTFRIIIYICIVLFILPSAGVYGGIEDTKHNLSITGPGPIKSTTEDRICIFCHTPDSSLARNTYLWNKRFSRAHYVPYQSSTLYAKVGQPTGSSKLCLSCHDGTIALGDLISVRRPIPFAGGIRFIPEGSTRIGTDLSDDHPISFVYDSALAISNGELTDPSNISEKVKLDKQGQLQCTTCHDPHNNDFGKFLVISNHYSNLCTTCHQKNGWASSSHSLSNASWNGTAPDPWPHTAYMTVSENGCENCHIPHTAGGRERLLNHEFEEDNCLTCHNNNVADTNIEDELSKPYVHAVQDYTGVHDQAEDLLADKTRKFKHVECFDCHNAHMSSDLLSPGPPEVSGATKGVSGVDISGQNVPVSVNQYEICFKCHADNSMITDVHIDRDLQQLNTRLEFHPSNPSFHPVAAQGTNPDVPSLLPPYTPASIIFCTDCHNNDDINGPQGPHGSMNKYLLESNYTTMDFTQEDALSYALCYKCHDRNSIINDRSFSEHKIHIVDEQTPCSACHDPHGISSTQGNSSDSTNLINFDLSIVSPNTNGDIYFNDSGLFEGSCALICHESDHEPKAYP